MITKSRSEKNGSLIRLRRSEMEVADLVVHGGGGSDFYHWSEMEVVLDRTPSQLRRRRRVFIWTLLPFKCLDVSSITREFRLNQWIQALNFGQELAGENITNPLTVAMLHSTDVVINGNEAVDVDRRDEVTVPTLYSVPVVHEHNLEAPENAMHQVHVDIASGSQTTQLGVNQNIVAQRFHLTPINYNSVARGGPAAFECGNTSRIPEARLGTQVEIRNRRKARLGTQVETQNRKKARLGGNQEDPGRYSGGNQDGPARYSGAEVGAEDGPARSSGAEVGAEDALIISIARTPPPCFPDRTAAVPATVRYLPPQHEVVSSNATAAAVALAQPEPEPASVNYNEECPSGRVYAYDLPSMFNKDLVVPNCTDLDPWNWECGIISNHGYGKSASELRRVLPGDLHKSWYHTNQFTLEVLFHSRILKHKCRTMEPESATAFYIPFYAGLAVGKHLWTNDTSGRDRHCKMMLRWIKKQDHWKKFNGSDHFMTIGRITWDFRRLTDPGKSWGSSFLNMPSMQKVTRFIIEKFPGDEMDVSVPYPTGFHPKTSDSLIDWQNFVRDYNRSNLFSFIGAMRNWADNDLRGHMMRLCQNEPSLCRLVDCAVAQCGSDMSVTLKPLLGSEFCLQPKGDSSTRKAVFDCMVAGSVPVFFWKSTAYDQYEWFLPGEPESYSVFIDHEEVLNGTTSVKEVLMRYSKEEIRKKREKVIETIPKIIYTKPNGGIKNFKDAFDVALDGVLERIKEEKEWADFLL
ncbi:hypothetical protein BUALT_Bualt04G0105500 [Buddleja alternifolia]|uniref:Exostosin GT47 domain-containing protein n=1 Tax=Buddleja alternifolia TaxID=168488 RepID=A0AAV6XZ33_9LAMI|nr:hypothetical protein BUALT_Bualt04G0105500 [Buddleja alternifolia]